MKKHVYWKYDRLNKESFISTTLMFKCLDFRFVSVVVVVVYNYDTFTKVFSKQLYSSPSLMMPSQPKALTDHISDILR